MTAPRAIRARLMVEVEGGRHLFYEEEALSVIRQLEAAGVFSAKQAGAVTGALRDEMLLEEARG